MKKKASETLSEKRRRKQRRRTIIKSVFAIILALMMVAITLAPIFAETASIPSRGASSEATDPKGTSGVSDQDSAIDETENYKDYIDFMMLMIQQSYYKEVNQKHLIEGLYNGIFDALDPHSVYFTPDEYERFNSDIEGSFVGIGASIMQGKDGVEVVSPIKGSPAEAAGIKTGDVIVEIDGEDARDMTTEEAVTRIRGTEGTDVTIGIARDGQAATLYFVITRALIELQSVYYELLDDGIGYIELTDFNETTNDAFDAAMAYFANQDIDKLIVDVRSNPGGLLTTATHVSDYFLKPGDEIVTIDYRTATDRTYRASGARAPMDVAVLINEGSASASEILAGSLQQTGNAIVVGNTSYGKGTVQTLMPLSNGGAIKMTIAEYKLEGDYAVDGVGIIPDIEVPQASAKFRSAVASMAPLNPSLGETSLNIYAAQQRLALLGYAVTADGAAGNETRTAVKAFQSDFGLAQTGKLDAETLTSIVQHTDVEDADGDPVLEAAKSALLNR